MRDILFVAGGVGLIIGICCLDDARLAMTATIVLIAIAATISDKTNG